MRFLPIWEYYKNAKGNIKMTHIHHKKSSEKKEQIESSLVYLKRLKLSLQNMKAFHHRIMANFLRKRGWVVFYLEEQLRCCHNDCWLQVYQNEEKYKNAKSSCD
jgi:hypothetical protein